MAESSTITDPQSQTQSGNQNQQQSPQSSGGGFKLRTYRVNPGGDGYRVAGKQIFISDLLVEGKSAYSSRDNSKIQKGSHVEVEGRGLNVFDRIRVRVDNVNYRPLNVNIEYLGYRIKFVVPNLDKVLDKEGTAWIELGKEGDNNSFGIITPYLAYQGPAALEEEEKKNKKDQDNKNQSGQGGGPSAMQQFAEAAPSLVAQAVSQAFGGQSTPATQQKAPTTSVEQTSSSSQTQGSVEVDADSDYSEEIQIPATEATTEVTETGQVVSGGGVSVTGGTTVGSTNFQTVSQGQTVLRENARNVGASGTINVGGNVSASTLVGGRLESSGTVQASGQAAGQVAAGGTAQVSASGAISARGTQPQPSGTVQAAGQSAGQTAGGVAASGTAAGTANLNIGAAGTLQGQISPRPAAAPSSSGAAKNAASLPAQAAASVVVQSQIGVSAQAQGLKSTPTESTTGQTPSAPSATQAPPLRSAAGTRPAQSQGPSMPGKGNVDGVEGSAPPQSQQSPAGGKKDAGQNQNPVTSPGKDASGANGASPKQGPDEGSEPSDTGDAQSKTPQPTGKTPEQAEPKAEFPRLAPPLAFPSRGGGAGKPQGLAPNTIFPSKRGGADEPRLAPPAIFPSKNGGAGKPEGLAPKTTIPSKGGGDNEPRLAPNAISPSEEEAKEDQKNPQQENADNEAGEQQPDEQDQGNQNPPPAPLPPNPQNAGGAAAAGAGNLVDAAISNPAIKEEVESGWWLAVGWLWGFFWLVIPLFAAAFTMDVYWYLSHRNPRRYPLNMLQKMATVATNLVCGIVIFILVVFFVTILKGICDNLFTGALAIGQGYGNVCKTVDSLGSGSLGTYLNSSPGPISYTPPAGSCQALPSGDASPAQLSTTCFGSNPSIDNTASIIAGHESGGNPAIGSGVDICLNPDGSQEMLNGQPVKVSWGLFQINLTAHSIGSLNCPSAFSNLYTAGNHQCQVVNPQLYLQCVAAAQDPQQNIAAACQISKNGSSWGAWQADINACGISPTN